MTVDNKEHLLLHADAEWMKDILKRIEEILDKNPISVEDIKAARWFVKQGLKCEREE